MELPQRPLAVSQQCSQEYVHCDRIKIMYCITGGSAACACHAAKPRGSFMAGALLWGCAAQAIHTRGSGGYANKAETSHTLRS